MSSRVFLAAMLTAAARANAAVGPDLYPVGPADERAVRRKNVAAAGAFAVRMPLAFASTWTSAAVFVAVPGMYFLPSTWIVKIGE